MKLFPAIDLFEGKAVRLLKGDYARMTMYSSSPWSVACDFRQAGAKNVHIVDLEGAKSGATPNFDTVKRIKEESGLFCEIGGGIREEKTIEKYLEAGIDRVILGTAAVKEEGFVERAVRAFGGEKIVVGADAKNGMIAVNGWLETSEIPLYDFCQKMETLGVKTFICTDISKDGAMKGPNVAMYKELKKRLLAEVVASGGVSCMQDLYDLAESGADAAIIGKAYYEGAVDLKRATEVFEV